MAKDASSVGELQVSKCYCETGRKRHRISMSIRIPFEANHPAVAVDLTQTSNADEQSIDDTSESEEDIDEDGEVDIEIDNDFEGATQAFIAGDFAFIESIQANELDAMSSDDMDGFLTPMIDDFDDFDDQELATEQDGAMEEEGPPRIATWRLNLTALSQVYNIYMVAYTDKIYVSRPRSCITNSLPAEPDLILQPEPSGISRIVGGYLDNVFPHQVNHLIVGDFGDEEILLLAYDDGDVIGYYTRSIEKELLRRETEGRDEEITPKPFFHENVGKSAWGLAVHKNSRLIAVSSNNHNVCVFIFALTGEHYRHKPEVDSVEFFRNVIKHANGRPPEVLTDQQAVSLENAIRRRDANWRIILETGPNGSNIPNIAFSNDQNGEADSIIAIDINGTLWIMDIWHFYGKNVVQIKDLCSARSPRVVHYDSRKPRGWGVLVLPESSFLPTTDYRDSLGLEKDNIRYVTNGNIGNWFDISRGIKNVRDNSTVHPWVRWDKISRFSFNPVEHRGSPPGGSWFEFDQKMKVPDPDVAQESQPGGARIVHAKGPRTILKDGSSILRTYELDIQLRSFEEDGISVMFEKVIDQSRPPHAVLPLMRMSHERLANLIHIPELSLVVAGSLCGRVALVTLTRPPRRFLFKRGFKVEAILPLKRDEDNDMRPICPLLGVAVGPVPFSGNVERASGPVGRRRYRIMLHYYDLRILSYEISRDSSTDVLSII
ncbi:hypothetical protein F5Y11DRAFT_348066 [Daldinia sp. FL1419]|nr:hypothetical protein F5Y11DRAFT_348066 [Daldinia sp. FL1419]